MLRPLIKDKSLANVNSNYRPVSNLPFLSKVLEKLVLVQLHQHASVHDTLPSHHSAYRKGYSCETVLAKILDDILWSMERSNVRVTLFLDLSAAFDTVDHSILHDTLERSYGITGTCLKWLDSYLQPRYCRTAVGSAYSETKEMSFSVPQGSCMGPSLFTMYAGSIKNAIPEDSDLYGYADDHTVSKEFSPSTPGNEELSLLSLSNTVDSIQT